MLNAPRRTSIRSIAWLIPIVAIDAITAYCHPNNTCDASRKMNDRVTEREAASSSGTGFSSAEIAAAANSSTPTSSSGVHVDPTISTTAASTTGTELAITADV